MADIRELGKRVKQKHPGEYDDLDDADLGKRVKAKFPGEYDDFTDAPEPKSVGGFASNVVKSGGDLLGGIAKAVTSPVQTAKNIGGIAHGAAQQNIRKAAEVGTGVPQPPGSQEPAFDAAKKFYTDRYGSLDRLGETAYSDPVGTMADASMVLGGAGAALKAIGIAPKVAAAGNIGNTSRLLGMALPPRASMMERVGQAGEALSKASSMTDPLVLAKEGVKMALPPKALATGARHLYQSALKPPPSWFNKAEMNPMLDTGLDLGLPLGPTSTPIKLRSAIDDIDKTVASSVADKAAQGATVDPRKVVDTTRRSIERFGNQVNPGADLNAINDVNREFLGTHAGVQFAPDPLTPSGYKALNLPQPIPIDKAQALKQGTYKQLRDTAYTGDMKKASIEGQKDLARGLKEEVYAHLPELAALGKKEKAMIDLDQAIERFTNRQFNHNIFGLEAPLAASAVAAGTGDLTSAAVAAMVVKALEHPAVKSRIAIAMKRLADRKSNKLTNPSLRTATAAERANETQEQP